MSVAFNMANVAESIAAQLSPLFGAGFTFYEDPNMQGTTPPCAFIQQRTTRPAKRLSGITEKTIGLDITVMLDYNAVDLQREYQKYAEIMDDALDTFTYSYVENNVTHSAVITCLNRNASIDMELHYKLELKVRVLPETTTVDKMESVELNEEVS